MKENPRKRRNKSILAMPMLDTNSQDSDEYDISLEICRISRLLREKERLQEADFKILDEYFRIGNTFEGKLALAMDATKYSTDVFEREYFAEKTAVLYRQNPDKQDRIREELENALKMYDLLRKKN